MKKLLTITLLSLAFLALVPNPSHAVQSSLSISPPTVEILLKPGKSFVQAFNIKNQGDDATITPQIVKIVPIDSFGHTTIEKYRNIPELELTLQNTDKALNEPFTLTAGESSQLVLKIKAAELAGVVQARDHYLGLALANSTSNCQQELGNRCTDLAPTLVSLVFVTVTPTNELPVSLDIIEWDLPKVADSFSSLPLNILVKNNSPAMIRPTGKIQAANIIGSPVYETTLFPNLILADATRTLQGQTGSLEENNLQPTNLNWTPGFKLGPHEITVTLTTSSGETIAETTKTVYLFPFKLLLSSLIFLLLATLLIYRLKNQENNT